MPLRVDHNYYKPHVENNQDSTVTIRAEAWKQHHQYGMGKFIDNMTIDDKGTQ